jgi:Protein of unknown function (DUF1273).
MGCFFSGHRELPDENLEAIYNLTRKQITEAIEKYDIKDFYAGGAVGYDMIASILVLSVKYNLYNHINLNLILPTPDYGSRYWKTPREREYYRIILKSVNRIETISPHPYTGINFVRNKRLIECGCDLGIVYAEPDHKSGGTQSTINLAVREGVRVVNIYDLI